MAKQVKLWQSDYDSSKTFESKRDADLHDGVSKLVETILNDPKNNVLRNTGEMKATCQELVKNFPKYRKLFQNFARLHSMAKAS